MKIKEVKKDIARTKSYHCIVCGAIDERSTVTVPGKEHTWSAEKIYDEKNDMDFYDCTKGGTKSYHCKECGAIDKDSREVHILTDHGKGRRKLP